MQKTFKAVRNGNLALLREILDTHPEEIQAVAKQPPKKDDGQSLLQVALKTGNLDAANLLLDRHADVNFMESPECCNEWRMPVLHDAIRCAVMSCRWNSKDYITQEFVTHSNKQEADKAFSLLKRILDLGADILSNDSYGNTTLERAVLDARQILPIYNYATKSTDDNRVITAELRHDLGRIFQLLYDHGASPLWVGRNTGKSIREFYEEEPVAEFLTSPMPVKKKEPFIRKLFHIE